MAEVHPDEWNELVLAFQGRKGNGWVVQEELGRGASAAVFSVVTPAGKSALKIYKPEFFEGQGGAAERFRLSLQEGLVGHDCASLVQVQETGEVGNSAYVLMEHLPWQPLDKVIGAIPIANVPGLIRNVAEAAIWMEKKGLVHRDIKPANILVDPTLSVAKVVDLGVIRYADRSDLDLTDQGNRRPFIATAQYSSPEYLFRLREPSAELWRGLTLYQLGGVLHDLLNARPLFQDEVLTENRYVLAMAVLTNLPTFNAVNYPARWSALARRSLCKDLTERLRQVSLDDFCRLGVIDLAQIRARLKLTATSIGFAESLAMEARRNEIQQRALASELRDALSHLLKNIGLRRVQWIQSDPASAWAVVSLTDEAFALAARASVKVSGQSVEVRLAQSLQRKGEPDAREPMILLWRGGRDRFAIEMASEILPQIEESFLVSMDEAESIVASGGLAAKQLPLAMEAML